MHRIPDALPLSLLDPPADSGDSNRAWHLIAVEGSWDGHAMGPFSLTRRMFDECVQQCAALGVEIPVDYEHASFWSTGKSPASGWISELEVRDGENGSELWADVSWTSTAAAHIRSLEYRYLSPVIVFQTMDRKTGRLRGASIHSVALTNTPFLDELPEVRLNSLLSFRPGDQTKEETDMDELLKQLAAALSVEQPGKPEVLIEAVEQHRAMSSLAAAILSELQLPQDATIEQARAAVLALRDPSVSHAEVSALRDRLAQMETEQKRRDARDLVQAALSAGKLTAPGTEQHTWACKFAEADPDAFKSWMDAAPNVVPTEKVNQRANSQQKQPTGITLSESTREEARRLGLSDEQIQQFNTWASEPGL